MHFKGDLALRLLIASALFVFVSVLNLLALLVQKFKYDLALRLLIASALFVFVSVLVLSLLALLVQKYKYWHLLTQALPVAPVAPGSRDVLIHESACGVLLFAVALGTRGSAAACLALATRKWWRWNV
jgi:hypothetical protein